MNLKRISDATAYERFYDLKAKVGDNPKHYLSQISRCKGFKKEMRIEQFYRLAVENGLTETAEAIKEAYPEQYDPDEIEQQKQAQEEAKRNERRQLIAAKKAALESKANKQVEDIANGAASAVVFFIEPSSHFKSLHRFLNNIVKQVPSGLAITIKNGNPSIGASYDARNGRAWTIAERVEFIYQGKSEVFNVGNITDEAGGSFGWLVASPEKKTFKAVTDYIMWRIRNLI